MSSIRRHLLALGVVGLVVAAGPAEGWAADARMDVQSVQVEPGATTTTVVFHLSDVMEGNAVSSFTMSDPERVIVDIADARADGSLSRAVEESDLINKIDLETFDDGQGLITRARVYLTAKSQHNVRVEGNRVVLSLNAVSTQSKDPLADALGEGGDGELSQAARSKEEHYEDLARTGIAPDRLSGPEKLKAQPSLASLDFKNLDDISRIVIGTNRGIDYTSSQPKANLFVIDFEGAYVPQSLRRVLDTGDFISPVKMVRAYPTTTGARVAITLRGQATPKVYTGGDNLVYVDFDVTRQMKDDRRLASQSFSTVGPSGSEVGLSNYSSTEILIGASGRTVDPRAAFGTGSGAVDPSSLLGLASGFLYDNSSASAMPFSGRRISLDFVNADIHSILRLISHVSRLNIVAGDDVAGKVTVRMEDVPWDQALAAILQAKGLGSQRFGNIIRVAPIETIKVEQQAALEAKRAQVELEELQLLVLPLNYSQANELSKQIKALLSPRGELQLDERGNQLIIRETEKTLAQVRELVRHLDKQTPQVLIEARIVEVSSSYQRALGIQWGGELDMSTLTGAPTGLFFPNSIGVQGGTNPSTGAQRYYSADQDNLLVDLGTAGSTGSVAVALGSITGLVNLDARLSALESDGYGKVVSSPRVTTLDNKQAKISQGTRIPYLAVTAQGTQTKFINAELALDVTPHITSDNKIFLKLKIENNRPDFSNTVQGQPAIQTKEAETEVLVADGDTTVLGGVFATEEAYSNNQVPGLGKIPILGYLFSNESEEINRNEMLVFITPHIVTRAVSDEG